MIEPVGTPLTFNPLTAGAPLWSWKVAVACPQAPGPVLLEALTRALREENVVRKKGEIIKFFIETVHLNYLVCPKDLSTFPQFP